MLRFKITRQQLYMLTFLVVSTTSSNCYICLYERNNKKLKHFVKLNRLESKRKFICPIWHF